MPGMYLYPADRKPLEGDFSMSTLVLLAASIPNDQ
ncbi:hypothetical protein ND16A_0381 [Thalassotalea sp. ND16A]|nr:hypothetical protein ND16A_0381 [Thalassotalea sp. ND16A]